MSRAYLMAHGFFLFLNPADIVLFLDGKIDLQKLKRKKNRVLWKLKSKICIWTTVSHHLLTVTLNYQHFDIDIFPSVIVINIFMNSFFFFWLFILSTLKSHAKYWKKKSFDLRSCNERGRKTLSCKIAFMHICIGWWTLNCKKFNTVIVFFNSHASMLLFTISLVAVKLICWWRIFQNTFPKKLYDKAI